MKIKFSTTSLVCSLLMLAGFWICRYLSGNYLFPPSVPALSLLVISFLFMLFAIIFVGISYFKKESGVYSMIFRIISIASILIFISFSSYILLLLVVLNPFLHGY